MYGLYPARSEAQDSGGYRTPNTGSRANQHLKSTGAPWRAQTNRIDAFAWVAVTSEMTIQGRRTE